MDETPSRLLGSSLRDAFSDRVSETPSRLLVSDSSPIWIPVPDVRAVSCPPSLAGVTRTKKKKQEKLKRQIASIRRATKKEEGAGGEARFAAMQLINDPQAFAESLFNRLQSGSALKFDTKMLLIQVLSRVVGLHRLHLLHLYPFLQRYVQPNKADVTRLLAAAATACHELVPPDALEPLLRQLVNQFVHDRARPEVVAVGINTVREICLRCPLVMHEDLLQDLAQYKRARDKPVATAARALIALFRELAPGMLEKKDRGKGARELRGFSSRRRAPSTRVFFSRSPARASRRRLGPRAPPSSSRVVNDERKIRRRAFIT